MAFSECSLMVTAQPNTVLAIATVNALKKTSYTPFGSGGLEALPGFNGEMCERLARHYLLGHGHRMFIPALMRFNRPDAFSPFGAGGLNAYIYCLSDPINYQDPTGRMSGRIVRRTKLMHTAGTIAGRMVELSDEAALKVARKRAISRKSSAKYAEKNTDKVKASKRAARAKENARHAANARSYKNLEREGAFNGKYTQAILDTNADEASSLYHMFRSDGGVEPDPSMINVSYSSGYAQLNTGWYDVNVNYHYLGAKQKNKKLGDYYPYQRALRLRKQFLLNHYNHPVIGSRAPIPEQVGGPAAMV
jgi:RHS repeat-associated protein